MRHLVAGSGRVLQGGPCSGRGARPGFFGGRFPEWIEWRWNDPNFFPFPTVSSAQERAANFRVELDGARIKLPSLLFSFSVSRKVLKGRSWRLCAWDEGEIGPQPVFFFFGWGPYLWFHLLRLFSLGDNFFSPQVSLFAILFWAESGFEIANTSVQPSRS